MTSVDEINLSIVQRIKEDSVVRHFGGGMFGGGSAIHDLSERGELVTYLNILEFFMQGESLDNFDSIFISSPGHVREGWDENSGSL